MELSMIIVAALVGYLVGNFFGRGEDIDQKEDAGSTDLQSELERSLRDALIEHYRDAKNK